MTDDIVTRLRSYDIGSVAHESEYHMTEVLAEAADEIERLRNAGDALAKQTSRPCRCVEAHDGAINETCAPCAAFFDWEEARRG